MSHKISFFFRTRTVNSIVTSFLARFLADSPHFLRLEHHSGEIRLLAQGNEDELAALADELGREIPLSIFHAASGITALNEQSGFEPSAHEPGPGPENRALAGPGRQTGPPIADLPPCPRCLRRAEDNFQAGRAELTAHCQLCAPADPLTHHWLLDPEAGRLRATRPIPPSPPLPDPVAQATTLSRAAKLLASGQGLQIITPAGTTLAAVTPGLLFPARQHPEQGRFRVLATSPQSLPACWRCGDDELFLLAALEKPLVLLEPNEEAQRCHQLPPRSLPVGLADDLFYWYLSRHLQALEIPLLLLADRHGSEQRPLMVVDNQKQWLLTGNRAILPLQAPLNSPPGQAGASSPEPRLTPGARPTSTSPPSTSPPAPTAGDANRTARNMAGITPGIMAGVTPGGLPTLLVTKQRPSDHPTEPWHPGRHLRAFQAFLATSPGNSTIPPAASDRLFGLSLAPESGGIAVLAVSRQQQPAIILRAADAAPRQIDAIVEQIAALDPQARRLLDNFARQYPQRWQALLAWPKPVRVDALADLWTLLLLICGELESGQPAAAQDFLNLAAHPTPGRSPRLELVREEEQTLLDHALLLRSAFSYTLAGTSAAAICRGFMESLAERLAHHLWALSPGATPRVALCTPLCLHPAFFQAIRRQGGEDFLLPPPPLPLDWLPTIGELWDQATTASTESQSPLPSAPDDRERRQLFKSAFSLFK